MEAADTGSRRRHFASDNYSGICPEVWQALEEANFGHTPGYGEDPWTARARKMIQDLFERDCEVFFAFSGTAANGLVAASACQSFHSVLCHEFAHLETDECGAPGFFAHGLTLVTLPGENGKLIPAKLAEAAVRRTDVHASRPGAISFAQSTEVGTVYTPNEIAAFGAVARKFELSLHMDGARFANAVAALNVAPAALTWRAGVDVLSFGGTKNGMAYGDAVVFFNRELARNFEYRLKQSGQLASKMRFLSAQWIGILTEGAWLRHAAHANKMAELLEQGLRGIGRAEVLFPREANAVFVKLPPEVLDALRACGHRFYTDVGPGGAARLMCSWDTREDDVDALVSDIGRLLVESR
ncbi:MAG TPA: low specificity L-threonine aldolase [Terrimicrobiaceae bacterium]